MTTQNARYWKEHLNLHPHPEGGYYREFFRSRQPVLRNPPNGVKAACTSIHYLLEGNDFSGFHRIASDELWYFHKGSALNIHTIDEAGSLVTHELSDGDAGSLSVIVEAGLWFAAEIPLGEGFTLVSCAVAPGFEFTEFEMAKKQLMLAQFPQHATLLEKLCRI